MPDNGQAPRKISTAAARGGQSASSASLDAEAIRRAIENSQEFAHAPQSAADVLKAAAPETHTPQAPAPETRAQQASAPAAPAPRKAAAPQKPPAADAAPLFGAERVFYDQDKDPDFPADAPAKRGKRRKKAARRGDWIFLLLTLVFSAVLLVSGGVLVKRYLDDRKTQDDFSALQELLPTPAPAAAGDEAAPQPTGAERFAALQAQNPECVGWISIPYTDLSYPVMHSPTRPNFYLKHAFDGTYSDYGVPYLDEDCTLTAGACSNNLIIYGHNMKTGIIFGPLTGYLQKEFYTVHPVVHLDTIHGSADYEVFAAFEIDVVEDPNFVYNEYYDMDEETFGWFVDEVISRSPVDSGITPVYGDDLLTLSTCEYTTANGRLVVCARRTGADA